MRRKEEGRNEGNYKERKKRGGRETRKE
jgi:hypothetical protein